MGVRPDSVLLLAAQPHHGHCFNYILSVRPRVCLISQKFNFSLYLILITLRSTMQTQDLDAPGRSTSLGCFYAEVEERNFLPFKGGRVLAGTLSSPSTHIPGSGMSVSSFLTEPHSEQMAPNAQQLSLLHPGVRAGTSSAKCSKHMWGLAEGWLDTPSFPQHPAAASGVPSPCPGS